MNLINDPRINKDLQQQEDRMTEAEQADALFGEDKRRMLAALTDGDANAVCIWAPGIKDWARAPKTPHGAIDFAAVPMRKPTVAEIVQELLLPDRVDQQGLTELVQLALNSASGRFGPGALREQANVLLGSWSELYADQQDAERKPKPIR